VKKITFTLILLSITLSLFSQTPRLSLLEEFTGETCYPCALANPGLNVVLNANASKAIAVKWQVPIPTAPTTTWSLYQTNSTDINARMNYYSVNSAPQVRMDGQHLSAFNASLSDNASNVSSGLINTSQSISSPFSITMNREWDALCAAVNLTITVQASANYTSTGTINFQTIMVERLVQFSVQPGNNGEFNFEDVAIKSFPSISGYSISNAWTVGQTETFTLNCLIPAYTRNKNEIALVGFIQDEANKKILQAERADKVLFPTDALTTLEAEVDVTCSSSITPQVTIYNNGLNPITSLTLIPFIDLIAGNTTAWNGNLAVGASTALTLNTITTPTLNGPHTFSYQVIMNTPFLYSNVSNTVSYLVATDYQSTPVVENFSALVFPPLNWTAVNTNNGPSWSRDNTTGSFGNTANIGAAKFNFYDNDIIGDEDALYLPPMNLSGTGVPVLSFDLAKATRGGDADQLDILVSKDCGTTWTNVYSKSGQSLATSGAASTVFHAPLAQDWRTETILLNGFAEANVLVKFKAINDNGNNMYLDNINLSQPIPLGVIQIKEPDLNFSLFPTPAENEINLEIKSGTTDNSIIKLLNGVGQIVYMKQIELNQGTTNFKIDTKEFTSGVYLVIIESANKSIHKKTVVLK